jgi:hypothetical protein
VGRRRDGRYRRRLSGGQVTRDWGRSGAGRRSCPRAWRRAAAGRALARGGPLTAPVRRTTRDLPGGQSHRRDCSCRRTDDPGFIEHHRQHGPPFQALPFIQGLPSERCISVRRAQCPSVGLGCCAAPVMPTSRPRWVGSSRRAAYIQFKHARGWHEGLVALLAPRIMRRGNDRRRRDPRYCSRRHTP